MLIDRSGFISVATATLISRALKAIFYHKGSLPEWNGIWEIFVKEVLQKKPKT